MRVRVFGVKYQGSLPWDEAGVWQLAEAPRVIENLNAVGREIPLAFELEQAAELPVDQGWLAMVPAGPSEWARAHSAYAATGLLSSAALSVVVVHPNPATRVQGWSGIDRPLNKPELAVIIVSTRVARSAQAHWIGHELGHIFGFPDTTDWGATARGNGPYQRCGQSLAFTTYPLEAAPEGAKQNLMSYNTELRSTFFSAGYAREFRSIIDCWLWSSQL